MLDNKNKITMGSLFSGFGGFEIAAQKHDINVLWQSEIEPWDIEMLKDRFPETEQLGDGKTSMILKEAVYMKGFTH